MTWQTNEDPWISRRIAEVFDLSATHTDLIRRSTGSILDTLSAPKLAEFRRIVQSAYHDGNPQLLCANCSQPVYVSVEGSVHPEERDGRDSYFAHYPGTAQFCEWGSVRGYSDDSDSYRPAGISEGPLHEYLRRMLEEMLRCDPEFRRIQPRPVISLGSGRRRPDVSATLDGARIAFDLQLGTTAHAEIVARERFYKNNGIGYMLITNRLSSHELARQSFQDIYWNSQCQIFAIDGQSAATSRMHMELQLWVYSVRPRLEKNGLYTVWERRQVGRSGIKWDVSSGRPVFPQKGFGDVAHELVRKQFYNPTLSFINALKERDKHAESRAGKSWNEIATRINGHTWNIAERDHVFKSFGVLSTVAAGKKMDSSRYPENALANIINNFLERHRNWTPVLTKIANSYGHEALLSRESTQKKIRRNLETIDIDYSKKYRKMLDVVFPRSILARLSGPPTIIVDV